MVLEEWRPVEGGPGYYVSNFGSIRGRSGRILKPSPSTKGYLQVGIGRRTRKVHRLVMEAFVGPLPAGMQTMHMDGDKLNNRLDNLKYGTPRENRADVIRHGHDYQLNKTHCVRGHELSGSNVRYSDNGRVCRSCRREDSETRRRLRGIKVRSSTHCVRGHALSGSNLYIRPDGRGRQCRACSRIHEANYRGRVGA